VTCLTPDPGTTWVRSPSATLICDLALVHLGGTRVLLHTVTMDATQVWTS
jgi:hypothetical protein